MSYGTSADLQTALFGALSGDANLSAAVDGQIFDSVPSGKTPPLFVAIGEERVVDRSDIAAHAADFLVTISVVGDNRGFLPVKQVAGQVSDILLASQLTMQRGCVAFLSLDRARAYRSGTERRRRVDLRFRVRVDDISQPI